MRIHWYSIDLVVYRARRAVHALTFFTAIHSPITQESDYWLGLQLKWCWFRSVNCDRNYSIRPIGKHLFDCNIKLLGLNSKNLPAKRKKQLFKEYRLILRTDIMSTFRICCFWCFAFSDT